IHNGLIAQNPAIARNDHRAGHARTSSRREIRRSHRLCCRWQIGERRGAIVKAGDLGELALRNLREAVLRNSLTTLGVAVGVVSLVAMLSLGVGLQELASKRLANSGLFDTVLVTSRRNLRDFNRPTTEKSASPQKVRSLDEDARKEMERLPNVIEVYPQIRFPTEVHYAGNHYSTSVAGVPASARGYGAFDGMQGNFFLRPAADETILQTEFAKALSDQPSTLIGKELVSRYVQR